MNYKVNQDRQRQSIISTIMGLMNDLQKLSSHPDQPQNHGPLYIKSSPNFKAANDQDTMLGSMMMESLLGTVFAEAVSDSLVSNAQDLDLSNAMECYSEYISDIESSTQKTAAHGKGTLARLAGKSIANGFNIRSNISEEMQSFLDDLPARMNIERNLAYYSEQLEMLDIPKYEYAA